MELETLKLLQKVGVPEGLNYLIPKVEYNGFLYEKNNPWLYKDEEIRWRWPYSIQHFIPGVAVEKCLSELDKSQRIKIAHYVGKVLKYFHSLPISEHPSISKMRDPWEWFYGSLSYEYSHFRERQVEFKTFDEETITRILEYLPKEISFLYLDREPKFIHSDITVENLIGSVNPDGIFEPKTVIDFSDSRCGDPVYELVAIHVDIFKCDKELLYELMVSYGLEYWAKINNFSYKAMCYTLLCEQPAILGVWRSVPALQSCKDPKQLEDVLWGFDFSSK